MELPAPLAVDKPDTEPSATAQSATAPRPMVRDLTLPSGGTVTFVDPEDLTGDDFDRVLAEVRVKADALTAGQDGTRGDVPLGLALDMAKSTAAMLIESWGIPYKPGAPREPADGPWPLPATDPSLLGKLKIGDRNAILDAIGPAIELLFPKPATPDGAGRPGSPTRPASA